MDIDPKKADVVAFLEKVGRSPELKKRLSGRPMEDWLAEFLKEVPNRSKQDFVDGVQAIHAAVRTHAHRLSDDELAKVSGGSSGSVSLQDMFRLQFSMQMMSQYIEAVSNIMSSSHSEMMTMARAVKGS